MRGKKRRTVDFDLHNNIEPFYPDEYEIPTPFTYQCNKYKLVQICDILGIDKRILICPNNGFTEQAMDNETRALQRVNRIVRLITSTICDLVSRMQLQKQPIRKMH
jgi:hypothetical protein